MAVFRTFLRRPGWMPRTLGMTRRAALPLTPDETKPLMPGGILNQLATEPLQSERVR